MRSRRYSVTKSLGGVSCILRSPLKEQDLCPHRNIFIPWISRARHGAASKAPSTKGNYKHNECEQLHHVGHGYPLNSERQFRNTSSHKLDMDILSNLRDSSAARRRWSKSRDWETQLKSIARRKTVFSDHVKEILPMIDTSSLDILMKESVVKRRNNEYQGALRWPLKLNLQQDLSLGENLPGKCLKYLVLYIPNMLPATSAIKKMFPFPSIK